MIRAEPQLVEAARSGDAAAVERLLVVCQPDLRRFARRQKFVAFNAAAEREDGAIPRKYRELIALGVALTTQCSYCIDVHTRHAREHGVTREELAEAAFVAAAVRAGGTLAHSLMALRLFDDAD